MSTPELWQEVKAAVDAGDPAMLSFEMEDVLDRVGEHGDLFANVLTVEQPCDGRRAAERLAVGQNTMCLALQRSRRKLPEAHHGAVGAAVSAVFESVADDPYGGAVLVTLLERSAAPQAGRTFRPVERGRRPVGG